LQAMADELLAVANAMGGMYVPSKPTVHTPESPSNNGQHGRFDYVVYLNVGITQSEQIHMAVRYALQGSTVAIEDPDGERIVLTADNVDEIVIPHAVGT